MAKSESKAQSTVKSSDDTKADKQRAKAADQQSEKQSVKKGQANADTFANTLAEVKSARDESLHEEFGSVEKKEKSDKNDKKDKKIDKALAEGTLGTARGIESMFRNSYRAQLDMITLAATKANIMISLNGSLLALLTLSSAYVLTNEPRLLLPTGIFLLTCIVSIFFAVLAARPQKISKVGKKIDDFRSGRADLLVFEDYAQLSKDEYMTAMLELMRNREGVYKAMLAHLHFLGLSADRRFRLLFVSYSSFFVGLMASFIVLAIITGRYFL